MRGKLLLFAAFALFALAWFVRPDSAAGGESLHSPLRSALGPLSGIAAKILQLRAAFARSGARFDESLQLQSLALELEPKDTDAVLLLSDEIAFDAVGSTEDRLLIKSAARGAISVLREAKRRGNDHLRLLDAEARLLTERAAPAGKCTIAERTAALDRAIELCNLVASRYAAGLLRGSPLLTERGIIYYQTGDFENAILSFRRAAAFESLLLTKETPGSDRWREANERMAEVCELDAEASRIGGSADSTKRAAALERIRSLTPESPFLAAARGK